MTNDHFDVMSWNATKYIVGRKMTLVFKFELNEFITSPCLIMNQN